MKLFPYDPSPLLAFFGMSLVSTLLGCGSETQRSPHLVSENGIENLVGVESLLAEDAPGGTGVDGVTMSKGECESAVVPANVPAVGAQLNKLTVSFCVKVTVRDSFTYDPKKWGFVFGSLTTDSYVGKDKVELVTDDGGLTGTALERKGKIVVSILFKDGVVPSNVTDQVKDENGRKTLKIFPFYSDLGRGPQESSSVGFNTIPGISMQNDLGAIKAPPKLGQVTTNDGSFVVEISPPSSLVSESGDPVSKAVTDVAGASSLLGYLLMYWNVDECVANPGGWKFDVNPNYDATRAAATDYAVKKSLNGCIPPTQLATSETAACNLGCDANPDVNFFNRSAQNVLQPKQIPTVAGKAGRKVSGCYSVIKIDGSPKSYAVDGLENGAVYGVTLFALDGSGRVGYGRSSCKKIKPTPIPLASLEKGASTKDSDCFVVTAASGHTSTTAVHFWRVVRDAYLAPTRVGAWMISQYYTFGPSLAKKLESQPMWIKNAFNHVFDFSGRMVLKSIHTYQKMLKVTERIWKKAAALQLNPFASSQAAADTTKESTDNIDSPGRTQPSLEKGFGENEGRATSPLSASSHLYILGGVSIPSEDKDLYSAYYGSRKPNIFIMGQTFRIFDLLGEFGAGAEFAYLTGRGNVPKETVRTKVKISDDVAGKNLGYYAASMRLVGDYSLRIDQFPYIRPRFVGFLGAQMFREQSDDPNKTDTAEKKEGQDRIAVKGAEGWSTVFGLRAGLQFSMVTVFGEDAGTVLYSYGIQDLGFHLQAGLSKDLAQKTLRTSGTQLLAGFDLLFL